MNAATCELADAPIAGMFLPVVARNDPRGHRAWVVTARGLAQNTCYMYAATKREATAAVSGGNLHKWVWNAGLAAFAAGVTINAPLAIEPATDRWNVEPFDRMHDQGEHCPPGGNPTCGDAVGGRLKGHKHLAQHRLGWDDQQWSDSLHQWHCRRADATRAWTTAIEDLLAGNLSDDEAKMLGATPETIGYLRLESFRRERLGSLMHPFNSTREYAEWWRANAERTCWAFDANGTHTTP